MAKAKPKSAKKLPLPDPKTAEGPYRPFSDPGWGEAWWWLGIPVLAGIFVIGSYQLDPNWYMRYVIPEGYGVLEVSHFVLPMLGLLIAGGLLFLPFVRVRPFTWTVTLLAALACIYIAGEEMSWGQHFFHWSTPDYWTTVNRQAETNLHNTYDVFEKTPRSLLELCIIIGGLLIPIVAVFFPRVRANRVSLFLPAAALIPAAVRAELRGLSRVFLVPDGVLFRLPFETLLVGDETYWIDRFPPIAYGHSGSVLLWCKRRREAQRGVAQQSSGTAGLSRSLRGRRGPAS